MTNNPQKKYDNSSAGYGKNIFDTPNRRGGQLCLTSAEWMVLRG